MTVFEIGFYAGGLLAFLFGVLSILAPIAGALIFLIDDRKGFSAWYWLKMLKVAPFFARIFNNGNKEKPTVKKGYSTIMNGDFPTGDISSYCLIGTSGVGLAVFLWFVSIPILTLIGVVLLLRHARRFQKRVDKALDTHENKTEAEAA
jgi:hypothetical protein